MISAEDLLVALAILMAMVAVWYYSRESFTTKREKAIAIYNWFGSGTPSYIKYKNSFPDGNIVEYDDALRLYKTGAFSAEVIESIL